MNQNSALQQISDFEKHYQYDSGYLREMLESSPQAYEKFSRASELSAHREKLDTQTHWTVKLAAVQAEDCGQCLQLNVRMAREAGIPDDLISMVLYRNEELPGKLRDLTEYTRRVTLNQEIDESLSGRIRQQFNKGELIEIGLSVAAVKLYPAVKRALGYSSSCSLVSLDI